MNEYILKPRNKSAISQNQVNIRSTEMHENLHFGVLHCQKNLKILILK